MMLAHKRPRHGGEMVVDVNAEAAVDAPKYWRIWSRGKMSMSFLAGAPAGRYGENTQKNGASQPIAVDELSEVRR